MRPHQDTPRPWRVARGQAGEWVGTHAPTVKASHRLRSWPPLQELAAGRRAAREENRASLVITAAPACRGWGSGSESTGRGLGKTMGAHSQSRALTRWKMLISEGQLMAEEVFMNALYGKHYIVLQYYTTLCIFCFQGCYNDAYSPIFLLIQIGHVP